MAFLEWNDSFATQVELFDKQHQHLFSIFNSLHDHIQSQSNKEVLSTILCQLLDYTAEHFNDEETLMAKHNYPALEQHREEHNKLKAIVIDFIKQYRSGTKDLENSILTLLLEWITNHIVECDQEYSLFFNERGIK